MEARAMDRCFTRSITSVHLVRILFCCVVFVVSIGCSPSAAPPLVAGPGFAMPAAGDATDSTLRIGDSFPELQSVDLDGNAVVLINSCSGTAAL